MIVSACFEDLMKKREGMKKFVSVRFNSLIRNVVSDCNQAGGRVVSSSVPEP